MITNQKEICFTEQELLDIQRYEFVINSPSITNCIKDKLKQTPPPKYFEYSRLKNN